MLYSRQSFEIQNNDVAENTVSETHFRLVDFNLTVYHCEEEKKKQSRLRSKTDPHWSHRSCWFNWNVCKI